MQIREHLKLKTRRRLDIIKRLSFRFNFFLSSTLSISGVTRNFGGESGCFDVLVGEFSCEFYQDPDVKENIYVAL